MIIIGINAYHGDSSACLVRDGRIVAAAEEERFVRVKHWAGFPTQAIKYCLSESKVSLSDVDIVAVNSNPHANFMKKVYFAMRQRPDIKFFIDRFRNQSKRYSIAARLATDFTDGPFNGRIQRVEHHLAHLASAFLVSPFNDACVASIDGFGDFSSTAWGVGRDITIDVFDRVLFPHSLGIFYQALTQYLGFPNYGDEYKLMGLAPYGQPTHIGEMRQIVKLKDRGRFEIDLTYFQHHRRKISFDWDGGSPKISRLFTHALVDLLGPERNENSPLEQRHKDIARSVQVMYEEAFFHLLRYLYQETRLGNLTLAGGCAMNSVANGKILRESPFKQLYVQSAAGDAGGAIGAAIYTWHQESNSPVSTLSGSQHRVLEGDSSLNRFVMDHAYLGPAANDDEIQALLSSYRSELERCGCELMHMSDEAQLCELTAQGVARGEVVGWFQGRMEWGPRALGNRSIVCDPRRADMKDILNLKIKRRESFRPFAPSVLKEHVAEWFEEDGDVPFMMQVYQIREQKRSIIPAVTHVDGSGRLQTVYLETNPRYWHLIESFRKITGVPMILNTSFNENEPVVCRAQEALDCFLRTKMDSLVIGNWFVHRKTM